MIKDNVELHLASSGSIVGSDNPGDYRTIDQFTDAVGQVRGKCLIGALDAKNITLSGTGTIHGRGYLFEKDALLKKMDELGLDKNNIEAFRSNRPFLIRLVRSENIVVKDLNLRQSAAWNLHLFQCKKIVVERLNIYSHAHRNNDGIDLDSSEDVIIRDCDIDTGDDAICFKTTSPKPTRNVHVSNCILSSYWGAIKLGTESMGDFTNIVVEKCKIHNTPDGAIKVLSMDGANISNLRISDIVMDTVDLPIFIRLGERLRTYRNATKQKPGSIRNVTINNIKAVTWDTTRARVNPPTGILITGTPKSKITNLTISNINITLPGTGVASQKENQVPEMENAYPNYIKFGVLPSYGIFARHVGLLEMTDVNIKTSVPDQRNEVYFEDVDSRNFNNVLMNGKLID